VNNTHYQEAIVMKPISVTDQYLATYAEKDIFSLEDFHHEFSNVVTIPAHDENIETISLTLNSIREKDSLVILVVNAQESSSASAKQSNLELIRNIRCHSREIWQSKKNTGITLQETASCTTLLIDKSSNQRHLPNKTGVGLARKISADIATKLIADGKLKTNWIHCTDADAILPDHYFQFTRGINDHSAAIYPYNHSTSSHDNAHKNAMLLYELSLRHYVIGLNYANSKHAFHSIGSTIALHFEAYAKVRGFPIRESGEDFYILNKLLKMGKIYYPPSDPILIDGRFSSRVPFGTGRSVEKITSLKNPEDDFLFYNAEIFEKLKTWISAISKIGSLPNTRATKAPFADIFKDATLNETLENIGAFDAIETALKSSKNAHTCQQHLLTWFDGFRTLKFVHQMRDRYYPSISLRQLIQQPFYRSFNLPEDVTLAERMKQFKMIEALLTSNNK
jgi:hypothetical protein